MLHYLPRSYFIEYHCCYISMSNNKFANLELKLMHDIKLINRANRWYMREGRVRERVRVSECESDSIRERDRNRLIN